jgi:hypothetical protein
MRRVVRLTRSGIPSVLLFSFSSFIVSSMIVHTVRLYMADMSRSRGEATKEWYPEPVGLVHNTYDDTVLREGPWRL